MCYEYKGSSRTKRLDLLHKLSAEVVRKNQVIILEDLKVSGMVKNRKLARAISQQGWHELRNLCEAKAKKYGRQLQTISHWEPTSQVCSARGLRWGKVNLKIREVKSLSCRTRYDRDENAARNVEMVSMASAQPRAWNLLLHGRG